MHTKKKLTNFKKRVHYRKLKDHDGELITDIKDKVRLWTENITRLFEDDREIQEELQGQRWPEIIMRELEHAIRNTENGEGVGPDDILTELVKCIDEETLHTLLNLYNKIYTTGVIPQEWLPSTFVTAPKTVHEAECSQYSTLSLYVFTLIIFLKIIHGRLYKKLEEDIDDSQFGS